MEVQPNTDLICQTCGSPGAQTHYRAVACGSCKIFFVRTVQSTTRYLCEKGSTCAVIKDNRNSCKACRFAECLKANMSEEGKLYNVYMPKEALSHPKTIHEQVQQLVFKIRSNCYPGRGLAPQPSAGAGVKVDAGLTVNVIVV